MRDSQGRDMQLTVEAEVAAQAYVALGGILLSGHRDLIRQAHDMAVNVLLRAEKPLGDRRWIALTYRHGTELQDVIDAHPEATTVKELTHILFDALAAMPPNDLSTISHHLLCPCPVFDGQPGIVPEHLIQQLPGLTKFLANEGGLFRCHMEFAHLPKNKISATPILRSYEL
jgi:hypothetical protein